MRYPATRRDDVVDVLHRVPVPDPYRWLEDVDSPETASWVKRENRLTFAYLKRLPARERIRERLTKLWDYERFSLPVRRGGRCFLTHNTGLQNQSVLFRLDSLDGEMHCLLDPNTLSKDGTVALSVWEPSEDGQLLAYGLSEAGSDWQTFHVRDVETGTDLSDDLRWAKFSGASWTKDGQGFFYSRYDEPKPGDELQDTNYYQKLYYHRLGTPQSEDPLIYERPDQKEWGFAGVVTDDGRYLVIYVWHGTERENGIFYRDLTVPEAPVVELLNEFDAAYDVTGNTGSVFYLVTDLEASNQRVIAIDVQHPEREHWREVIPEASDAIESASFINGRFLVSYLHDAYNLAKVFREDGSPEREIPLPGLGAIMGFAGRQRDRDAFYMYSDFVTPGTVFRYDTETGDNTVFRRPQVGIDPDDYVTEQVFYHSKDGTRVPMFIVRRKDVQPSPDTPCLLYGYGGFDAAMTPWYSSSVVVWLERGGVYALANIRGGGEYGTAWHDGGRKLQKQNCFDDFIAAAEWLIANGYTSTPKLAIGGASNGGLLTGACLTQRPDLFGAVWIDVGVLDMLRFDKFTIGWAWVSDYGSPDDPEAFKALLAYSPYHNLRPGTRYPATFITTADHDDRVLPAHSLKFAAALQAAQGGDAPTLVRIETRAGHGGGKPTDKEIAESADVWAFLEHALSIKEE
jgi:prolyl oligopeptidase